MFEFPVADLMMGGSYGRGYNTRRIDYLKLLVATMVATPEEQAEYAALARPSVEAHWQKRLELAEKRRIEELEQLEKDIAERERDLPLLRRVGAFEHAVKMEIVLERMRDLRGSPDGYRGNVMSTMNFKGFPFNDGSEFIYELKYAIHQTNEKIRNARKAVGT